MQQLFKYLLIIFLPGFLLAQGELDCKVQVMAQQIQGTNKQVFRTLQTELYDFMNNRKWTDHVIGVDERIDCNIMITITDEISVDEFKGKLQIQARRPIYNTAYNSVLLNFIDNNFHIQYVEYEPLEFNETGTSSNLVSLMAYYAYIIIGFDYDSYSLNGGTEFYQKAEEIVTRSQNAQEKGWKAFESLRNRYWLVNNLLDDNYSPIRECVYRFHRHGLDIMSEKVTEGRSEIAENLRLLQQAHRNKPGSYLMQIFFDAKSDELVKIFSESFPDEKSRVIQILTEVDPANSSKYNKIKESGNSTSIK